MCLCVYGKLSHGTISSHPKYMLFCNVTLLFLQPRGKVSCFMPLNLGQIYFAFVDRMWQKTYHVNPRVLASKGFASFTFSLSVHFPETPIWRRWSSLLEDEKPWGSWGISANSSFFKELTADMWVSPANCLDKCMSKPRWNRHRTCSVKTQRIVRNNELLML